MDVGLEDTGVIGRGFDAGAGIEVAADGLDCLRELARVAALGALEGHVLEEMRDAVLVRLLVAAAGPDPHAKRGGFQMRHGVGDDCQPGWKLGEFDGHSFSLRGGAFARRARCRDDKFFDRGLFRGQDGDALFA